MVTGRNVERTFELLWGMREPPSRGPKPGLSLARIVEVAIEIADAEGLPGLSMRKVAEQLGVTTMSLYRYVPSKDDLVELMFDQAAGAAPDPATRPPHWRDALQEWATQNIAIQRRHTWTSQVPISHPPFGPNNLRWMEYALQAMDGTGLTEHDMMGVLVILAGYVRTQAQLELTLAQAAPHTGVAPEEWNRVYGEMLVKVVTDGRHPALAKVIEAGVFAGPSMGPDEDFEYGLSFILDGVEALIRTRTAESS